MYGLVHRVVIFGTDRLRDTNACTDRKPHKQIDQQVDQTARRAHRADGFTTRKLPHNHKVRGVEQQLQKTRRNDRQGIKQYFFDKRTAA